MGGLFNIGPGGGDKTVLTTSSQPDQRVDNRINDDHSDDHTNNGGLQIGTLSLGLGADARSLDALGRLLGTSSSTPGGDSFITKVAAPSGSVSPAASAIGGSSKLLYGVAAGAAVLGLVVVLIMRRRR